MTNYIFLDLDGVVSTERHYLQRAKEGLPARDDLGPFFDPLAVENLRLIIEATQADVVITSSWRFKGAEAMQELWMQRQMPGMLLDITPTLSFNAFCLRGMEILKWLAEHAPEMRSDYHYVIIDDCCDFLPEQMPLTVITDSRTGLSKKDAEKAIALLQS